MSRQSLFARSAAAALADAAAAHKATQFASELLVALRAKLSPGFVVFPDAAAILAQLRREADTGAANAKAALPEAARAAAAETRARQLQAIADRHS